MVRDAKRRAMRDNLPFDLTVDDITIPKKCPVLGVRFDLEGPRTSADSPTLDRIKPHLGYVKSNVIVICSKANRAKSDLNSSELRKLAAFVDVLSTDKQPRD